MKESEYRCDVDGTEIRGLGLRRGNRHGVSGRGHDRYGRGAGRFDRDFDGPGRDMGRFGRGPERGARGFVEGSGRQGRGSGEGPRAGLRIERLIEQVDTNDDGTLTVEELEAFREKMEDRSR